MVIILDIKQLFKFHLKTFLDPFILYQKEIKTKNKYHIFAINNTVNNTTKKV